MRRRRRSRGGGSSLPLVSLALLLAILLLVATAGTQTAAFTSGSLARGSAATVADDVDGIIGLDVAGSVTAGSSSRIITVTNRLDRPLDVEVTAASVSLSNAQATLDPGQSLVTSATISCDSPPDTATVTVVASSASQFSGTATRSVTVDTNDCTNSNGPFAANSSTVSAGTFSGPSGADTGSVGFALNNTGGTAQTITGFELVAAGGATTLSFDGPQPVNVDQGKDEVYIDATGGTTNSDGAAEDGGRTTLFGVGDGVTHSLDQNVTVDAGESAQVSLYQFIEADGTPYTFQPDDEVTIAFTLQDGTQSTVTMTVP